jgi:hypothetical protein
MKIADLMESFNKRMDAVEAMHSKIDAQLDGQDRVLEQISKAVDRTASQDSLKAVERRIETLETNRIERAKDKVEEVKDSKVARLNIRLAIFSFLGLMASGAFGAWIDYVLTHPATHAVSH